MKIDSIDVDSSISRVRQLLETERDISPALKSALEVILLLVSVLLNRVTLNSKNSSKPPYPRVTLTEKRTNETNPINHQADKNLMLAKPCKE